MSILCTLYSVSHADVPPVVAPDQDDEDRGVVMKRLDDLPTLDVGMAWSAIHFSLGNHRQGHPLAFMETGGDHVAALEADKSEGRFFDDEAVRQIHQALAAVTDDMIIANFERRDAVENTAAFYPHGFTPFHADDLVREVGRLRAFLAELVAASRGIIIHTSA